MTRVTTRRRRSIRSARESVAWAALVAVLGTAIVGSTIAVAKRAHTGDRNDDGRADVWRLYDAAGRLQEQAIDTNFDGQADVHEYYRNGVLARRETDRDFDRRVDFVEEFDSHTGLRAASESDIDRDGTIDLVVSFDDGRVVSAWVAPGSPAGAAAQDADWTGLATLGRSSSAAAVVREVLPATPRQAVRGWSAAGGLPRDSVPFVLPVPSPAATHSLPVPTSVRPRSSDSPRAPPSPAIS